MTGIQEEVRRINKIEIKTGRASIKSSGNLLIFINPCLGIQILKINMIRKMPMNFENFFHLKIFYCFYLKLYNKIIIIADKIYNL